MPEQEPHSDDAAPSGAEPEGGAQDGEARDGGKPWTARRVLKYVFGILGGLVGFFVVLVLVFVGALQTNWGAAQFGRFLFGLANPFDQTQTSFEKIGGNFLSHVEFEDLRLFRVDTLSTDPLRLDTVRLAQIDTLRLRYDLLDLFAKRIHLEELTLAGPDVTARQQADSTWDVLQPFLPDTTVEQRGGFAFQLDQLRVTDGDLAAVFYAPDRDSTFRVDSLDLLVSDLYAHEDDLSVVLDTLSARASPPGVDYWAGVRAGGAVADRRLVVQGLRLDSPNSRVRTRGTLLLPGEADTTVQDIDFTLTADPLAFQDLQPFAPGLPPDRSLTADVRVTGTSRSLDVDADARLSDGATIDLTGTLTPRVDADLAYRLEASVRRLDPAFFSPEAEDTGLVNADFQADLTGTTLETLDGTLSAVLFDTRFGEYALDRTTLDARFAGGQARVDLETGLRGSSLVAGGTIRPFDEVPTYDFEGSLRSFDLGKFSENPDQFSDVSGQFRLEGRGFDPQTARLTAVVELAPSTVNRYEIQDGRLRATLADGDLDFDTRLVFPEGVVAAEGRAVLGEDVLRYRVSDGRFENLDVAALVGDTTSSSLTGAFSLQGRGTDPQSLRLTADVNLAPSRYGPYRLNDASIQLALRGGRLDVDGRADLEGGSLAIDATARPFDAVPSFTVTEGRFENLDVGPFLQDPTQTSDLTGTFTLTGRGTSLDDLRLEGRVDLAASRYNQQQIEGGLLEIDLDRGDLALDVDVMTPEGRFQIAGTGRLGTGELAFTLEAGRFEGVNLATLLNQPALETNLSGTITVRGANLRTLEGGFDPQTANLTARIDLGPSTVNDLTINQGEAQVELSDGLVELGALLDLEEGAVRLNTSGRFFDERPTYQAEGSLQRVDVGGLMGVDTLEANASLAFDVEGAGFEPASMALRGTVTGGGARYQDVRLDTLTAGFALEDGLLVVDTLRLRSNVADVVGGGQIALFDTLGTYRSDFTFFADVRDLAPLQPFVDETIGAEDAQLAGRVTGPPGALRFNVTAEVRSLVYGEFRLAGFEGRVAGAVERTPELTLAQAEVHGEMNFLSIPGLVAEQTAFDVTYREGDVTFDARLTVDERRDARLRGRVDLRPDSQRVVLEDLTFRFDEDRWELLQEATVTYGEQYRVSNLLLYSGDQQIAIDGVIDPNGEQSLIMTIESFRAGTIADLLGFEGLGGTVDGSLVLSGPAAAPNMDGTLNLDVQSFGEAVGDLRLILAYDSLRMDVDARLTHEDGSTLTAEGYVPLDLSLAGTTADDRQGLRVETQGVAQASEVHFTVLADSFAIGWVLPFLDREVVDRLDGRLTGELAVDGTFETPLLSGEARLFDVVLGMPQLGLAYQDIRADLGFESDRVVVRNAQAASGGGTLLAEGTVALAELTLGRFDIDVRMDDFLTIDTPQYHAVVDATLDLTGTTQAPVLRGTMELLSTDIYLTSETAGVELEPVQLSEQDLRTLERRFGLRVTEEDTTTFDFYEALTMDLAVEIGRNTWLRSRQNPNMDIQFTGDLDLSKRAYQDVQLFGSIEVVSERSYVTQFGKRFDITSGTLTFNGPATEPILDIQAEYEVRSRSGRQEEVTITLEIEGRPDNLTPTFGSDPAGLDLTDIVSYIATGRPASESLQLGGQGGTALLQSGTGLALSQLTNYVEGVAGAGLGLDVISIEHDGLRGYTITAGKYLSNRFYVSVSQPISFSENPTSGLNTSDESNQVFTVEWEVYRWLLIRAVQQGSISSVNLLWEYAY